MNKCEPNGSIYIAEVAQIEVTNTYTHQNCPSLYNKTHISAMLNQNIARFMGASVYLCVWWGSAVGDEVYDGALPTTC